MRVDAHTHCFPDALADRAIGKMALNDALSPRCDGTVAGLLSVLDRDGIDACFVLNIATNAHQQDKVNAFAETINHYGNRVYSFGSIHPDYPDIRGAAKRIKEAGLYGVKLHPDFMGFDIDDTAFRPIFAACSDYALPVVIHSGIDPTSRGHIHAKPEAVAGILKEFPDLRLCAAHFGDASNTEDVLRHLCGKNVWFDTGFTALGTTPEGAKRILENHDPDKILFGSDMPWEAPSETMAFLETLGLSEEQKQKIFGKNAEAFIHIQ